MVSPLASDFDAALRHVRRRLREPLPGTEAQLRMAPGLRQDRSLAEIRDKACREAGVLALFYPEKRTGRPVLVLTVRHDELDDHAGQISFPGGQREAGETLRATALREAREEIGLAPDTVDVLGPITPLYIPPSNFCVHPFVGAISSSPSPREMRPTDAEVEAILHVPLAHLLWPETTVEEVWPLHGQDVRVPFYDVEGRAVWGATAMMLSELLALFDPAYRNQ